MLSNNYKCTTVVHDLILTVQTPGATSIQKVYSLEIPVLLVCISDVHLVVVHSPDHDQLALAELGHYMSTSD